MRIRVDEIQRGDILVSRRVEVTRVYASKSIAGRTIVHFRGVPMANVWLNESMVDVERAEA